MYNSYLITSCLTTISTGVCWTIWKIKIQLFFQETLPFHIHTEDVSERFQLEENSRLIEFIRFGQLYKLEAIMRREAPTTTDVDSNKFSLFRKLPWDVVCFHPCFQQPDIICGDSWGHNKVILATHDGTYLVEDGAIKPKMIFDRSVRVKQLDVLEEHGIIIMRVGDDTEGVVCVFKLSLLSHACYRDLPYTRLVITKLTKKHFGVFLSDLIGFYQHFYRYGPASIW